MANICKLQVDVFDVVDLCLSSICAVSILEKLHVPDGWWLVGFKLNEYI